MRAEEERVPPAPLARTKPWSSEGLISRAMLRAEAEASSDFQSKPNWSMRTGPRTTRLGMREERKPEEEGGASGGWGGGVGWSGSFEKLMEARATLTPSTCHVRSQMAPALMSARMSAAERDWKGASAEPVAEKDSTKAEEPRHEMPLREASALRWEEMAALIQRRKLSLLR